MLLLSKQHLGKGLGGGGGGQSLNVYGWGLLMEHSKSQAKLWNSTASGLKLASATCLLCGFSQIS